MKLELQKFSLNDKVEIDGNTKSVATWIGTNPTLLSSFIRMNRHKYKLGAHAELELKAKLKTL